MLISKIELKQICVDLENTRVIDQLTLAINQGEFVAILGANGTGKTTLLKVILGLLPMAHGSIDMNSDNVGYVPQRLPLQGGVPISVMEYVSTGLRVKKVNSFWINKTESKLIQQALKTVGLLDIKNSNLFNLSGGQQRRVMIARALVSNPDILLLDEPTAGIDSDSQESLKEVLEAYKKNLKTIILVTHELEVLEPLVDRVVVLGTNTKGSVIYDGKLPIPKHLYSIAHHSHEDSVNSKSILGMNNS